MEVKNRKIYTYVENNKLNIEQIVNDYTNYVSKIIRNSSINLSKEDTEEVILDVFMTLWKNTEKLDTNKSMSAYISGITKNLIKYKFRQYKESENIYEYEEKLIDFSNIEVFLVENEKEKIISTELDKLKSVDKEIFIQYYYNEKSIKEICSELKLNESKVKSKLFRTRKKLGKALKERGYNSND